MVDFSTDVSVNSSYAAVLTELSAREKVIRDGNAGSAPPTGIRDHERWTDTSRGVVKMLTATAGEYSGLWPANGGPWSAIAATMNATGTVPDSGDGNTSALPSFVRIAGLSATTTITFPQANGMEGRLLIFSREDTSANTCTLTGAGTDLQPYGITSGWTMDLYPGDLVGFAYAASYWHLVIDRRTPRHVLSTGGDQAIPWWATSVVVTSGNAVLPDPTQCLPVPYTISNQTGGASTVKVESGDDMNGTTDGTHALAADYNAGSFLPTSAQDGWFIVGSA